MEYVDSKADAFWTAAVLLGIDAGLGAAELFGIQVADVNFRTRQVHVRRNVVCARNDQPEIKPPKAHSRNRKVKVSQHTLDAISALLQPRMDPQSHLFTDDGALWRYDNFKSKWARLLKRAGIPHYGWHSLRHTMATRLLQMGMPLAAVSKRLGHSSVSITLSNYAHALDSEADAGADFFTSRYATMRQAVPADAADSATNSATNLVSAVA